MALTDNFGKRRQAAKGDVADSSEYFLDISDLRLFTAEEEYSHAMFIVKLREDFLRALLAFPVVQQEILRLYEGYDDEAASRKAFYRPSYWGVKKEEFVKIIHRQRDALQTLPSPATDVDNIYSALLAEHLDFNEGAVVIRDETLANMYKNVRKGIAFFRAHHSTADQDITKCQSAFHELTTKKKEFAEANVRLVVAAARSFNTEAISLSDRIAYGNMGLVKAIDRFEPRKGYRFSTYALWWIDKEIKAAIHKTSVIHLPDHMNAKLLVLEQYCISYLQKKGRSPTEEEICDATKLDSEDVRVLCRYREGMNWKTGSLDDVVFEDSDAPQAAIIEASDDVVSNAISSDLRERIHVLLLRLNDERKKEIIERRFGLNGYREHTLQECADVFRITRERVRQIETSALRTLQLPHHAGELVSFLDD